jgi:hypothetical protein
MYFQILILDSSIKICQHTDTGCKQTKGAYYLQTQRISAHIKGGKLLATLYTFVKAKKKKLVQQM